MNREKDNLTRIALFFVTLCCIATFLLPNIFIAEHGSHIDHGCGHEHCTVCIRVQNANNILSNHKNICGSGAGAAVVAVYIILIAVMFQKTFFSHDTLIELKIRLDN